MLSKICVKCENTRGILFYNFIFIYLKETRKKATKKVKKKARHLNRMDCVQVWSRGVERPGGTHMISRCGSDKAQCSGLQQRARDTVTPEKKALIQRTKTSHINEKNSRGSIIQRERGTNVKRAKTNNTGQTKRIRIGIQNKKNETHHISINVSTLWFSLTGWTGPRSVSKQWNTKSPDSDECDTAKRSCDFWHCTWTCGGTHATVGLHLQSRFPREVYRVMSATFTS